MAYKVCKECGAVEHGNLFCNTCRIEQNKFRAEKGWALLPPWNHPAENPCGVEDIQPFLEALEHLNKGE